MNKNMQHAAKQQATTATLLRSNHEPRSHGSEASQSEWQSRKAALRREAKLPFFPASESATDAVTENLFTFGKASKIRWNYKSSEAGERCDRVTSEPERLDKSQDSKWIRNYVPWSEDVTVPRDLVTTSQCSRVTWLDALDDSANEITVIAYGKPVIFRKTHKQKATYGDSRFEKPQSLSFAKAELRRLLGATEGDYAFVLLCRPATLPPNDPTLAPEEHGSRVAVDPVACLAFDEQGIRVPLSITPTGFRVG